MTFVFNKLPGALPGRPCPQHTVRLIRCSQPLISENGLRERLGFHFTYQPAFGGWSIFHMLGATSRSLAGGYARAKPSWTQLWPLSPEMKSVWGELGGGSASRVTAHGPLPALSLMPTGLRAGPKPRLVVMRLQEACQSSVPGYQPLNLLIGPP